MKTVGSLFAGVGGLDLGFERAGFDIKWCVEWDEACQSVLRRHFPKAALHGDAYKTMAYDLEPVDLITFGFPCTSVSNVGQRKGLIDDEGNVTESGLFFRAAEIIYALKPRVAMFENVPGLFTSKSGEDFRTVLNTLGKVGYDCSWVTLDSRFFGVAQRRERVFGICTRKGEGDLAVECLQALLLVGKGEGGHSAQVGAAQEEVAAGTIGGVVGAGTRSADVQGRIGEEGSDGRTTVVVSTNGGLNLGETHMTSDDVAATLRSGGKGGVPSSRGEHLVWDDVAEATGFIAGNGAKAYSIGYEAGMSPTLKSVPSGNTQVPTVLISGQEAPADDPMQVQWWSGGGKLLNDTAQALRSDAETNYQFLKIKRSVRRFTPVECERLQSFPDGWTEWGVDADGDRVDICETDRYRMMGNAVTTNVANHLARSIKHAVSVVDEAAKI